MPEPALRGEKERGDRSLVTELELRRWASGDKGTPISLWAAQAKQHTQTHIPPAQAEPII